MNRVILTNCFNQWKTVLIYVTFMLHLCERKLINIRRWWTKPHLRDAIRDQFGAFNCIFSYFKHHDTEEFYKFVGMSPEQFNKIFTLVRPHLQKRSRRRPLKPELRLAATLK